MSNPTIAFLAGLGTGYFNSQAKKKEDERRDKRDARDEEVYQEGKADRAAARERIAREDADKNAIRTAAAPVDVQTTPGQAMPAEAANPSAVASENPTTGGYKVGAKTFAERGVADTEAAAQNTPEATRKRVSAAMMAQGNVLGADQLETSGLQAKAAKIKISEAERAEANAIFDRGIKESLQTGGPQALAKFMSESQADGQGGKVQFQAVMAPDGKSWQMMRVGDGGALQPFGQSFPSDEAGMALAGLMLSRTVGDDKKVAHLMAVKEAERRAKHDETSLSIQQQNADTNERYRNDMVANAKRQAELTAAHYKAVAAGKVKADGAITVGLKDMRDFESDLNGYIKDQYPVKDGADPKERAQMQAQATAVKASGSALFRNNAAIGIPLTAGTVLQAMELAKDRQNIRIGMVGDVPHEMVMVNGQSVVVSGPMQKKAPAPAPVSAPVAPRAAGAAGMAAQGIASPATAQAPALTPQDSPEAIALDRAREMRAAAQEKLRTFGLKQRNADPQAYQQAVGAHQSAIQAEEQALARYQAQQAPMTGAAFRYRAP